MKINQIIQKKKKKGHYFTRISRFGCKNKIGIGIPNPALIYIACSRFIRIGKANRI